MPQVGVQGGAVPVGERKNTATEGVSFFMLKLNSTNEGMRNEASRCTGCARGPEKGVRAQVPQEGMGSLER